MAVSAKKLDIHPGDLLEVEGGDRYEVVTDRDGGLALERAVGISVAELDQRHGIRPATSEEIEEQLGRLPRDGEG